MGEKYSITDLQYIAEDLVEELRECEYGTEISTSELLKISGYDLDEFEYDDLFDLHYALFKAARENHIHLDMSAHNGLEEGLPFNLDFIVRNKSAQIKCPYCGSRNTARYIYGYPAFDERMQKKLDAGKWVLGGCCLDMVEIGGKTVNTMPARKCNECRKDFGKAPILITTKKDLVEDYRDIVTSIYFSVGGYFGGYTDITVQKNRKGAMVKVEYTMKPEEVPEPKQITPQKWKKTVNRLYSDLHIHEWKKNYIDPSVLDGTQWELKIRLTNGRKRTYYGSNDYPPYWDELVKIFSGFAKL